jgi:hypothetical protein
MGIFIKAYSILISAISKVFWIFELFLFLRFLLKFLNANPLTPVVNAIYLSSDIFVNPFNAIFNQIVWKNFIIDTVTISAMAGYALVVFVLMGLLKVFERN